MLHTRCPLITPIRALPNLQPPPQVPIDFTLWPANSAPFGLEDSDGDLDELVADLRGGQGRGDLVLECLDGGVLLWSAGVSWSRRCSDLGDVDDLQSLLLLFGHCSSCRDGIGSFLRSF